MASAMDKAAQGGIEGIQALFALPGGEPAFFGMKEEAELLATVRRAVPGAENVFWGVDYEVAGDRTLLRRLQELDPPESARESLAALIEASSSSWAKYEETNNPQYVFSFSGDPALVTSVRASWPDAGPEATSILDALQSTLEINQFWVQGKGFASNQRRADFLRQNFLDH